MSTLSFSVALTACRLLGDAASGRPLSVELLPDSAQLLGFSKAHRLETLISSALRTVGADSDTYHTLHTVADIAAFHQTKNDLITADVLDRLSAAGIGALPLKGAAIQAVYPDGWIRTATDTDLYINSDDLPVAAEILKQVHFTQAGAHNGDICFVKPPRTVIELHTTLGGYSRKQRRTLKRLGTVPFTVNEHYVYALFHLYQHLLYAGAGVRLFFDLYRLSQAVTDRGVVVQWLDDLELRAFEQAVLTVNGILFDGNPSSDAMDNVIELILRSGAFGNTDTHRAINATAVPKTRFRRWLNNTCFDHESMVVRYPVLKGRLWLYPFCAAHRIVKGFFFKRTVWQQAIKSAAPVDRTLTEQALKALHIL